MVPVCLERDVQDRSPVQTVAPMIDIDGFLTCIEKKEKKRKTNVKDQNWKNEKASEDLVCYPSQPL